MRSTSRLSETMESIDLLKFRAVASEWARHDHAVIVEDPESGNDTALLAVFNNQASAERLADLMNFMARAKAQCECEKTDKVG